MADDDGGGGRLLALYRRYIGEPGRAADVYLGYALFFGGIALAAIGFVLFLWSGTLPAGTPSFWTFRELAIVTAFLGLPVFVLSVVVLLPVSRRVLYAAGTGAALCVVAVAVFVAVYPANWNVQGVADYSAQGIAIYAAGLAFLAGSTGSALVAHHLERARPVAAEAGGSADAPAATTGGNGGSATAETVTDDEVRRDIEEAVDAAEISWGGVEKTETRRLRIDTSDAEASIDRSGFDRGKANTARSGGVDDAVEGLRRLQGGQPEAGTAEGVDAQTAALRELREQREAEEAAEPDGFVDRLRRRIGGE